MKRKILNILLLITTLFILVSCIELNDKEEYISPSQYEAQIIETTKKIQNTTVSLMYKNKPIASAVIIEKSNSTASNLYTAVTTAQRIKEYSDLGIINEIQIATSSSTNFSRIDKFAYNEKYDVAVIQFSTKSKLDKATMIKNEKVYNYSIGQTIITIGTSGDLTQYNSVKVGRITNNNLEYNDLNNYAFMHDATNNPGEKGAGVFDISGNLIGLNGINYISVLAGSQEDGEHVLGSTLAIPTKGFAYAINNLTPELINSKTLPDLLFESYLPLHSYESKHLYEKNTINLNNKLNKKSVTITKGLNLASGLLYSKDLEGNYWVITKSFDDFNDLEIYSYNHEKLQIIDSYKLNDYYLSIHKVSSANNLDVYTDNINIQKKGQKLIEGQKIVSFGTPINFKYSNTLSFGTLSKRSFGEEQLFMHDGNLNYGQHGAPLYNLDGQLIGFNVEKVNEVGNEGNEIMSEGLGVALNINYAHNAIKYIINEEKDIPSNYVNIVDDNLDNYISKINDEKILIDLVKKVMNKTVTVKTQTGHGSGIIFKEEKQNDNTYLYSLLTNHHVISNNTGDVTINFNNDQESLYAKDFVSYELYDLAIIRFISIDKLEVYNSRTINEEVGINPVAGQTVIAVGTPSDVDRNGYVSTGNITTPVKSYGSIPKLAILHNTAINPGNSGGPLFDLNGNLIGLNVSKITYYETYNGIHQMMVTAEGAGTSLNLNVLSPIINSYRNSDFRRLSSPRIGIFITDLKKFSGDVNQIPSTTHGVVVIEVDERYNSHNKLYEFDIITYVDGNKIIDVKSLGNLLRGKLEGDKITVKGVRLVNGIEVAFSEVITFK